MELSIPVRCYQGDSVCIAFRYTSNTTAAATYYVDSIQITGTPITVGIKNIITTVGRISVYPNPSSTNVTIESPQQTVIRNIKYTGSANRNLNDKQHRNNLRCFGIDKRGVYCGSENRKWY